MKKIIRYFLVLCGLGVLGLIGVLGITLYISYDLPQINSLSDYNPAIPSKIYSKDGTLLLELAKERREIVAFSDIPIKIVDAFLAAEDDNFYKHSGVDYIGIARAMVKNIQAGRIVQGASTITQQVAKSLLLTSERTFTRKIKDLLLAKKIEDKFTKQEILFLYLNQIYLGGGYYGIKSAYRGYFDKELDEASIAETALIAGLLVAPGKYSPYRNPKYAKRRQEYVLGRLYKTKKITVEEYESALKEKIRIKRRQGSVSRAGYFTDWVRQRVIEKLGNNEFLTGGYEVITTIDWELQHKAEQEVIKGLKSIDKRQGFKGPLLTLEDDKILSHLMEQKKRLNAKNNKYFYFMPDGTNSKNEVAEISFEEDKTLSSFYRRNMLIGKNNKDDIQLLLKSGTSYKAVVEFINDNQRLIYANIAGIRVVIPEENFKWAHSRNISAERSYWSYIKKPSRIVKRGDVIHVSLKKLNEKSLWGSLAKPYRESLKSEKLILKLKEQRFLVGTLDQEVDVEGALLSVSASTGEIVSLVGGYSFEKSQFNRVVQSNRQPGSAFKPLIFATGLEQGFTAASILLDSPQALGAGDSDLSWKPRNYDGKFKGSMTFRKALETSRNIPTIKLAKDIGVKNIINFVERMDMKLKLPEDLSLSLGSFGINLLNLVKLYTIFPNGGEKVKLKSIISIKDRFGKEHFLEQENSIETNAEVSSEKSDASEKVEPENPYYANLHENQVYDRRLSYIMANILKGVVQNGTGRRARDVSSFIGGKTGTTNNYVDAWFLGFSSKLVTGVWTGFDNNETLGWGETGAKSALPIWKEFMKLGIKKFGESDFRIPSGIVNVMIDKERGTLAEDGGFIESFVEGTEPGATKESEGDSQGSDVFDSEDYYYDQ